MFLTRSLARMLLAAALLFCAAVTAHAAPSTLPDEDRIGGFALGCQAYSFNHYSAFEAIEKTAQAGGKVIEFYPGQRLSPDDATLLDQNMSDEAIAKLKQKLKQQNVVPVAFGVVDLTADEAQSRKVFEFARKLGLRTITSEPGPGAFDTIEKLVKEYDIRVAIHNHPRDMGNPDYRNWDPNYVLSLVKNRDRRIGVCADTGHWVRSGIKPLDALRILRGRVLASHLKDLNAFGPEAHDVPYGTGISDIKAILDELKRQGFDGHLSIEYEYDWESSVPEIAQCIGYVRGYGAAQPGSTTVAR